MYIMLCTSLMLHPIKTSLERTLYVPSALQWRHDEPDGVSSHRRLDFVLNCMFRRRSKKASKLRVTGFCEGISPVSGEFPSQRPVTRKIFPLRWRHNDHAGVSNHQPHGCWLNRLFRRKSKKTSKLRFTGLCAGNSPGTGEFPAQMASYAENVSIWWRHHAIWRCHHGRKATVCCHELIDCSIVQPCLRL